MPFVDSFEIDIITALAEQLVKALDGLTPGALNEQNINSIEKKRGVYALLHKERLVYVGKADNLRTRLHDHREKINGRLKIQLADVSFKCLYVHPNWTALAPEKSLIDFYKREGEGCDWNGIGFGPHDPGRERETTNKPPDGFDAKYPINYDLLCSWIEPGEWNIKDLLVQLKARLPFLLRFECKGSYRKGHPNYNRRTVRVRASGRSARALLRSIAREVPGWQATLFASHMIFYREKRRYKYGKQA